MQHGKLVRVAHVAQQAGATRLDLDVGQADDEVDKRIQLEARRQEVLDQLVRVKPGVQVPSEDIEIYQHHQHHDTEDDYRV